MKKFYILLALVVALNADVSAFKAGNLDSDNPYGLTRDEKYILKNKKNIETLQKIVILQNKVIKVQESNINTLKKALIENKQKIDNLEQAVNGISTIVPSFDEFSAKIKKLRLDLNNTQSNLLSLKTSLSELKKVVSKNRSLEKNDTLMILTLIENMAKKIDSIKSKNKISLDLSKIKSNKLFKLALKDYQSKKFSDAYNEFYILYSRKYKIAEVLFYLGEIEYKNAKFKKALSFYKKSIEYLKNPKYFTDDLLYHAGYSFEQLKNYDAAKKSYLKLIYDFPKSILVKYAKKRLKNLEKEK
jgi:TolA-binding protein